MVGPASAGASNKRSMVSSAAFAPAATAQTTRAGAKQRPEWRESVMLCRPYFLRWYRHRSLLQPRELVANLVQPGKPARAQPRLVGQDIPPPKVADFMMACVQPPDLVAGHRKRRPAHLLLLVLHGNQQRLRTGTRQRGHMCGVRLAQCRRPGNQRRAIVNSIDRPQKFGAQRKKIAAQQSEVFGLINFEIAEYATPGRNAVFHAERFKGDGRELDTGYRVPAIAQPYEIEAQDRKSTRLNSSHDQISYAVFC